MTLTVDTAQVPVLLFTVADAIARRGMPEPKSVTVRHHDGIRLDLDLHTRADLLRWAKRCGIKQDAGNWHEWQADRGGVPHAYTSAWGTWHGAKVALDADEPVAEKPDPQSVECAENDKATVRAHYESAGWAGPPGECGVECACGTTFDGFDTIAAAAALLDGHIARADEAAGPGPLATESQDARVTR